MKHKNWRVIYDWTGRVSSTLMQEEGLILLINYSTMKLKRNVTHATMTWQDDTTRMNEPERAPLSKQKNTQQRQLTLRALEILLHIYNNTMTRWWNKNKKKVKNEKKFIAQFKEIKININLISINCVQFIWDFDQQQQHRILCWKQFSVTNVNDNNQISTHASKYNGVMDSSRWTSSERQFGFVH